MARTIFMMFNERVYPQFLLKIKTTYELELNRLSWSDNVHKLCTEHFHYGLMKKPELSYYVWSQLQLQTKFLCLKCEALYGEAKSWCENVHI